MQQPQRETSSEICRANARAKWGDVFVLLSFDQFTKEKASTSCAATDAYLHRHNIPQCTILVKVCLTLLLGDEHANGVHFSAVARFHRE